MKNNLIKKVFKRMAWLLLLLVVLLLISYQSILRTQAGSSWVLGFVTEKWLPELSYQKVTGSLLGGLKFENLSYQDSSVDVAVIEFETGQLVLSYFQPAVVLSKLKANGVSLKIKETAMTEKEEARIIRPFFRPGTAIKTIVMLLDEIITNKPIAADSESPEKSERPESRCVLL